MVVVLKCRVKSKVRPHGEVYCSIIKSSIVYASPLVSNLSVDGIVVDYISLLDYEG